MMKEQIINLWKIGYSKKDIYELEYLDLKKISESTDLEIQKKARFIVDSTINKEYLLNKPWL